MNYINKLTGSKITSTDYNRLSYYEKSNWMSSSNSGNGDFGISMAIGAATDSALLGGLLGGDIVGGMLGDMLDGDLMD